MAAHYPWRVWELRAWLESEMKAGPKNTVTLAQELKVSHGQIWQWLALTSEAITLDVLKSIAHCRHVSLDETVQWLDIKPAHLAELFSQTTVSNSEPIGLFVQ